MFQRGGDLWTWDRKRLVLLAFDRQIQRRSAPEDAWQADHCLLIETDLIQQHEEQGVLVGMLVGRCLLAVPKQRRRGAPCRSCQPSMDSQTDQEQDVEETVQLSTKACLRRV